jgi:2-C-methyl-D-erythritol 2,4-cyclodiphosphate synthase
LIPDPYWVLDQGLLNHCSLSFDMSLRIGQGFDVHAFGEGDHVTLGGVSIPFGQGLRAHSDGDVLLHALMDALLGALALGDIGKHFPDTDSRFRGADSRVLLRAVMALLQERGWRPVNIDTVVIAERPRLSVYIDAMRATISADCGVTMDRVSVKATTTEGLGFTGRGEGIAAQAVVLLEAVIV